MYTNDEIFKDKRNTQPRLEYTTFASIKFSVAK